VLAPDDLTTTEIAFPFDRQLSAFGLEIEPDETSPGNLHDVTATYLIGSAGTWLAQSSARCRGTEARRF
jgi:hypothetical protein